MKKLTKMDCDIAIENTKYRIAELKVQIERFENLVNHLEQLKQVIEENQ